ncbi:MAG: di-heme oxidoredictase family protein [Acidimicrobiia bacterium]|nr:di-heme oxidoredictase family protein [Acidimicrobiia bacterium]
MRSALLAVLLLVVAACGGDTNPLLDPDSGGDGTVAEDGSDAFSQPLGNLDDAGVAAFQVGNEFFRQAWVVAPGTEANDGLGPLFNATACITCHVDDGRSRGPDQGVVDRPGLIVFLNSGFDESGIPVLDSGYGGQIQDRSIDGVPAEAVVVVDYEDVVVEYPDGTSITLRRPAYTLDQLAFGGLAPETSLSPRVAPPLIGMGLLEAVSEDTIAEFLDIDDSDDDGISGWLGWGRFGWKASIHTLQEQTEAALHGDIGITSDRFPSEDCPAPQLECRRAPNGGSPEVSEARIGAIVNYLRTLAVPARRDLDDPLVAAGAEMFGAAGCDACHRPTLTTGESSVPAASRQEIHPYTDLLLHDMGPGLADTGPGGAEWRTPPLWGIGLTGVVGGHTTFLHDGRARSLEEAIMWHSGEASAAQRAFAEMAKEEREALIAFLKSL